MKSKLPRTLAIGALVVGFLLMATWWYINAYNPFHFPTAEQARALPSFSPPPLYTFLDHLTFTIFPALWLQVFTTDLGTATNYAVWIFAILVDCAVLYCVGMVINAVRARMRNAG